MADTNVVNPGIVNVADEGYPLAAAPPPVVTAPAASAAPQVDGGTYSPTSPNVVNTMANTVVGQPGPQFNSTINVNV
jgi:hypothetical protein